MEIALIIIGVAFLVTWIVMGANINRLGNRIDKNHVNIIDRFIQHLEAHMRELSAHLKLGKADGPELKIPLGAIQKGYEPKDKYDLGEIYEEEFAPTLRKLRNRAEEVGLPFHTMAVVAFSGDGYAVRGLNAYPSDKENPISTAHTLIYQKDLAFSCETIRLDMERKGLGIRKPSPEMVQRLDDIIGRLLRRDEPEETEESTDDTEDPSNE